MKILSPHIRLLYVYVSWPVGHPVRFDCIGASLVYILKITIHLAVNLRNA